MKSSRLKSCALLLVALAAAAFGQQSPLSLSYITQFNPNAVVVNPGGTIQFGSAAVNASVQAILSVTNVSGGAATINSISIANGTAFRVSSLPTLPSTLQPGASLQVQLQYQPAGIKTDSGQLSIIPAQGSEITLNLLGVGTGSSLVYQLPETNPPTTISPGGTIPLPDTTIGQTSSIVVRILNSGNASGLVNSVGVIGPAFQLDTVLVLPQTVPPGGSITFVINFTPTQPGSAKGTLVINSDVISLIGVGLGPRLEYSYTAAGTTIVLNASNPSVVFSPVAVTQSGQLTFNVKNTGTASATISNIGIAQSTSPFSVSGLPALPLSLAAGAQFQFAIIFKPVTLAFSTGTLQIDTTNIPLTASGTQPPALPAYTIGGATGAIAPRSQPRVSLTLASPYPVTISGTLSLAVSGNLPADPAVQFASGGRTVSFQIPANTTGAVFNNGAGTQIGFQTGTVAETIVLTPTFATQAGGIDLTPGPPNVLQLTVAPAAPTLIGVSIVGESATGFSIAAIGFTTSRSLTNWTVTFTPVAGFNMPKSQFTINLQQVASPWFLGTASQAFGGQFTVTVPFAFQGTPPAGQSLVSGIASVSVSVSNEQGASNTVQATLQ